MARLVGSNAHEADRRKAVPRPTAATRPCIAKAAILAAAVAGFLALFSGQALAHQIGCGDTITQDTTLHGNLTNCQGDGLVIDADNITLDLNGHTIDGVQAGERDCELQATGVSNPAGHDGVTIQNGTVREFGDGIRGGYGRSRLRNLTVRDNRGLGIVMVTFPAKHDIQITQSVVARNGCGAISLVGPTNVRVAGNRVEDGGINLIGVNEGVVTHNSVSGGNGILGLDARFIRIEHNAVSGGQDGIFLLSSSDNRVSKNSTSGNFFGGINLKASSRNRVSGNSSTAEPAGVGLEAETEAEEPVGSDGNVVSGNRSARDGVGVLVLGSDANQIAGNHVVEALEHPPGFPLIGGSGITVDGGSDNVMAANTIERPEKAGVRLLATPAWGGVAAGNVLRGNAVRDAGGDGVLVDSSAAGSLLEANVVKRSADDGFDVASPAAGLAPTTLTRNRASRNGNLGINAGPGVTDGGGNKARGNGNPAQCTRNIICG